MDVQHLTGKTVVTLDEAERLGTISDVLFQTEPLRVAGFRVSGPDDREPMLLPFRSVRALGEDAVTIERRDLATNERTVPTDGVIDSETLHALKIVDEDGTYLGTVDRIDIDADGRVVSVDAVRGGVMGVGGETSQIDLDAIRSIGPEVLTVRTA